MLIETWPNVVTLGATYFPSHVRWDVTMTMSQYANCRIWPITRLMRSVGEWHRDRCGGTASPSGMQRSRYLTGNVACSPPTSLNATFVMFSVPVLSVLSN